MSNPDALVNSHVPTPDLPVVPEEPVLPEEEETPEAQVADEPIRGTFPAVREQPETQGDLPLDAELGDEGEGDLAPGDDPDATGEDAPTDLRTAE